MQISNRFTMAVHICTCILMFENQRKVTSEFLADSTGVNPVIIRNVLSQLKASGIVGVRRGAGGAFMQADPMKTTLLDIAKATDPYPEEGLFHFHENPNPACPVGANIHILLDQHLDEAQKAMERSLDQITIHEIYDQARRISNTGNKI